MTSDSTTAPEGATTLTIREQWDASLATWEAAKVAADFAFAAYSTAHDEAKGEDSPGLRKMADHADKTGDAQLQAFGALILTPAPDHGAVLRKMTALYAPREVEGDEHSDAWVQAFPEAVIADLERLQSEAASAWLDRWTTEGGSVVIDDEGRLQTAYRADSNHKATPSGLGEEVDRQEARWHDGHYHGTMTALYDALRMFGGASAIKAHMCSVGARQIAPTEQGK